MKLSLFCFALLAPLMGAGYGNFPLRFEERATGSGQFVSRGTGYAIRLHAVGADLAAGNARVSVTFEGANQLARAAALGELETRSNYLTGSDPRQWRTNLRNYSRVRYSGVYKGIDLEYYGSSERKLEYDFIVAAGAEPKAIRMQFTQARIDAAGNLVLGEGIVWQRPVAYQDGPRGREAVQAEFVQLAQNRIGFKTGAYDRSRPLIIDPVLQYVAYLGGSGPDEANAIAADAAGNTYITGLTRSVDFPTRPGAPQSNLLGSQDVIVAKISPNGSSLIYATYIGGNATDVGNGIAIDAQGNAYVTGRTDSTNFPVTTGAFQTLLNGGSGVGDAFAFKLDATGSKLLYSTYLGGSLDDQGNAIAVDKNGNAYVAGQTLSTNFPQVSPVAPVRGGTDAFVTKISADGSALVYSTCLGGFGRDVANAIALDSSGAAYVTGETRSDNFPISAAAFQKIINGASDAFLTKISADGTAIVFSTFFGGETSEEGRAVAVDSTGSAWIAGKTSSSLLPQLGSAIQRGPGFLPDGFVTRFAPSGQFLQFSSYLGGEGDDQVNAIAVDANDNLIAVGQTNSAQFAATTGASGNIIFNGITFPAVNAGGYDAFVVKFNSNGSAPMYSTCIGGKGDDYGRGVALDAAGNAYIAGVTGSTDLKQTGTTFQPVSGGGGTDAFVARITELSVTISPLAVTLVPGQSQQFTGTVINAANTGVVWTMSPAVGNLSNSGLYTAPANIAAKTTVTITAASAADPTRNASALVTLQPVVVTAGITVAPAAVSLTAGKTQQFSAAVTGLASAAINWSLSPQVGTIDANGNYTAPYPVTAAQQVTVTARSVSDGTVSGSASISLAASGTRITPEGVTNAASFQNAATIGGVSPGLIVTIFGAELGPQQLAGLQLTNGGAVDTVAGGVRVLFDGIAAPMIYAVAGQVSCIAPFALAGKTSTQIQVEYNGNRSNAVTVPVQASSPAIFTANASGSGQGAILNQDNSVNSAANPAASGAVVVIYATGAGLTNPDSVDGKLTGTPLPLPRLPVSVTIGGAPAEVLYAGGAPGLVAGVLQVNARVPAGLSGSAAAVKITVGAASTLTNVLVSIK